jgi:hypothetical protein
MGPARREEQTREKNEQAGKLSSNTFSAYQYSLNAFEKNH